MAWMEHGLQILLKRYALSMEDKMAPGAFERARNYGLDSSFKLEPNSNMPTINSSSCIKADLHSTLLSCATSLQHGNKKEDFKTCFKTLRQYCGLKCRKRVIRKFHATKSYCGNQPLHGVSLGF